MGVAKKMSKQTGSGVNSSVASNQKVKNASKKLIQRVDSEVREAFTLFDKDGDGKITRKEIEELIKTLEGDTSCPHVQDLQNASDALGSVEINQFLKLWQRFKQAANKNDDPEDEIKKSFQQFDINGDGYITKDEITEVIKSMDFVGNVEKEVDRCLADMDVDGNGSVSYAEFMVKWKFT